ncbi:MAG: stage V sporulation protein AE [Clostridia bacterium]|nr:stage V sporulation protein AE [Clostridia bacterium]
MQYLWVFLVGGGICAAGQVLIDRTKLTPARILVIFVVSGVFLTGVGLWKHVVSFAGAGATVPIVGFGYSLAEGVKKAIDQEGALGILTGGLKACAAGITASVVFGFIFALISKSKEK